MRILGTGSALPAFTLDNERLTEFLDTSDEWIRTRTGICSRQIITDETLLQLGADAARRALDNAHVDAADIDFIICSTVQGDFVTPSMACLLQNELGAACPAVDINGACAGFIYALDMADAYLKSGKAGKVLVICAEAMSRIVDWTDRSTCVLFGDGAGAAVLDGGEGLFSARLTSAGNSVPLNCRPNPGNSPFATVHESMSPLYMDGPEIYKFAVSHCVDDLQRVIAQAGLTEDQVSHYLLHQANKRIVDAARVRLKQPQEKFHTNIAVRGNTSSASIPILLDEVNRSGSLKKGDLMALSAFGAGLTTGACVFEWTKD
jgi:3-oxoacyl-[acyl-carrier-protein] synthase-3